MALPDGTALADTTLKLVEVITSPERTETLKAIVAKFEAANDTTLGNLKKIAQIGALDIFDATRCTSAVNPESILPR